MKKVFLLSLCAVVVLGAIAGRTEAGEKKFKLALVCKALDSEFWQDMRTGGLKAGQELGVEVIVMGPDREVNVQQQVQIVEDLITQRIDGLALAPCGAQELIPVMQSAKAAGIPVILVDTDANWSDKLAYVGTNNRLGGRMAAEHIAKSLDGKGKVALITGVMGHQTHIDRVEGAEEIFKKYPDIKIVSKQPANSQRDLAMSVMENILTSNPDLDFVFATAAVMAMGAYEAIAADNADTQLIGFDADTEVLTLIKQGKVDSLIAQDPTAMGYLGIQALVKVLKGGTIDKVIDVPTGLVTRGNVDQYFKK
jgi:ribose transport system substrate-binding protein